MDDLVHGWQKNVGVTAKNYFKKNLDRLKIRQIICFGLILLLLGGSFGSAISLNQNTKAFALNNPPVTKNDSAVMAFNTAATIDVLANDTDADNDELTITSASNGAHGQVGFNIGFVTKWGLSGEGHLNDPLDVAVDSSGNIYVADTQNFRIQKFTTDGDLITKLGTFGTGDDQFSSPRDVAVDLSGNVFVADSGNNRIQKFNSSGTFLTKWGSQCALATLTECIDPDVDGPLSSGDGQFNFPTSLAIDSSGYVYVIDRFNHRIQKFDNNGNFVTKWGDFGTGDSQFNEPAGIAVDLLSNVYVTDSLNHRIQKFDSNGVFITKWTSSLSLPAGIAADSSGNIYVVDFGNNRIQKFYSNGNFLTEWGSSVPGDGGFNRPSAVDVNSTGNVYVADTDNHRIQKFDSSGNFGGWLGSCLGGSNCNTTNGKSNGFSCTSLTCNGPFNGGGVGQFYFPSGIAVDSFDNFYVADTFNNRIQKFDSSGNFITEWGTSGSADGQFGYPRGIVVDLSGNVYVADTNNNRIQKFSSTGTYLTQWGTFGTDDGKFNTPFDVSVDSSGNVYVADSSNSRIQKFDSSGTFLTKWGCASCRSITADLSGNFYALNVLEGVIKFDSNGNFITKWGTFGSADGQFDYPSGMTVDSSGNVYVSDTENNRIQKFGPGKVIYTPDVNFIGTDSFTYTISDAISNITGTVFVRVSDAPFITGIVADDPDGSDSIYSNGDTITVKFSKPTNQPFKGTGNQLTKANLDSLFLFSQNLGADYTGKWLTSSTLLITIQDITGSTPPTIGGLTLTVKESADLKNSLQTTLASTFTSPPLSGSFGIFTISIPVATSNIASTVLPSGTTTQVELPQVYSGSVNITRAQLSNAGSNSTTLAFVGTIVDITPPSGSCSEGCEFSFVLDAEDLNNAGITLDELRIYHDRNHNGTVEEGEIIKPAIRPQSPTGPYTIVVRDNSTSVFAVGGIPTAITIIQHVINDNGGNATASDFVITLTGSQTLETFAGSEQGTPFALNEDIYQFNDTAPTGYQFISISCSSGLTPGLEQTFQLNKGDSITCTITYDDIGPTLKVIKKIIKDDGGTLTLAGVTLKIDTTTVTNDTTNNVNAGIHTVSETPIAGYTKTITGDCATNGSITLALGDVKTCTITNNDSIAPPNCSPVSGNWNVTSSCILQSNFVATGNVTVRTVAVLTIPAGVSLDIDFTLHKLLVKTGGGVLIKTGGKIF